MAVLFGEFEVHDLGGTVDGLGDVAERQFLETVFSVESEVARTGMAARVIADFVPLPAHLLPAAKQFIPARAPIRVEVECALQLVVIQAGGGIVELGHDAVVEGEGDSTLNAIWPEGTHWVTCSFPIRKQQESAASRSTRGSPPAACRLALHQEGDGASAPQEPADTLERNGVVYCCDRSVAPGQIRHLQAEAQGEIGRMHPRGLTV